MAKTILFPLYLQLFAEGAGGTGGATGNGTGDGSQGVNANSPGLQKGVNSNPLANVVYGKQQDDAQSPNVQKTTEAESVPDPREQYKKLIKGEYKQFYDEDVQGKIQDRLKNSKELVEKYNALEPVRDLLSRKYGVDGNDPTALLKAIEEDDSYFEQEALEKGTTVDELKKSYKLQRENSALKEQLERQKRQEGLDRIYAGWQREAEQAKSMYPSLDLSAELQNPKFNELLAAGVDVKTAYEVIHKDEIIPAAMQVAVKTAQQKLSNNIRAGGARPIENGSSAQSSAVVKSDVSKLNSKDLREIALRVQRGEKISFS